MLFTAVDANFRNHLTKFKNPLVAFLPINLVCASCNLAIFLSKHPVAAQCRYQNFYQKRKNKYFFLFARTLSHITLILYYFLYNIVLHWNLVILILHNFVNRYFIYSFDLRCKVKLYIATACSGWSRGFESFYWNIFTACGI